MDNLKAGDIQLLEDGAPQKIAVFEGPGTSGRTILPVEVILLFDVSMSVMNENLLYPFMLKETLLDGIGGQAGISMYAFAQRIERFTCPTRDVAKLKQAMEQIKSFAHYGTRLYEAIKFAAQDASQAGGNVTRLMVIFSDGERNHQDEA